MPIRSRGAISGEIRHLALAALASVAIGAAVTRSPIAAIAVVVFVGVVAVALTKPWYLFAASMLLLTIESTRIFGDKSLIGQPGTYKFVFYACAFPLLLDRGFDRKRWAPVLAYVGIAVLTESVASPLPGLTTGQTASSVATLSLAWLVFSINWDWRRDYRLLKLLAWLPTLSVLIGAALQAAGVIALFRSMPPRLQGATIAATLGALGVVAVIACVALYRREAWQSARWLGFLNVVILGATLSRGAAVALCIASTPTLLRFWRHQLSAKGLIVVARVAAIVTATIVGAIILGSGLIARSENETIYLAGRGIRHEVASGRLDAWAVAYSQATVNLAFGRGLGAGPLVGKTPGSPAGFTAQHNEYLRMLLEGGFVGGILVLLAIAITLTSAIRRAPPRIRIDLIAAGVAFAVYSFTENTLTAPAVAIAFLLVFGISCSRASPPRPTLAHVWP